MSRFYRWRFAVVLVAALCLAAVQPIVFGPVNDQGSFDTFFSVLVLAVLLSYLEKRMHRVMAIVFAGVSLLATWSGHGLSGNTSAAATTVGYLSAICFFTLALYGILQAILTQRVSANAVVGAICGYLLLGIIWGLVYSTLETVWPHSFTVGKSHLASAEEPSQCRAIFSYYSFVTLTTLGYGDITPASPAARTLAWLEAMVGQVYLAVLVAGIVGMKVARAARERTLEE